MQLELLVEDLGRSGVIGHPKDVRAERRRQTAQPTYEGNKRTGYKSRGLNGPPYFNTSFKHFFTVESLLA